MAQIHSRERVELARVGAPINHSSGNGEEEGANHAVGKHLQNRAGNAEDVGGGQAEQNETHVTDTGITDNEFKISLTQRDRSGINDPDHGENCDPGPPHLEALRKKIHRHAQGGISAEFHHDAGEQHRARGGRGDMTGRCPGVQRPDTGEHGKPEE